MQEVNPLKGEDASTEVSIASQWEDTEACPSTFELTSLPFDDDMVDASWKFDQLMGIRPTNSNTQRKRVKDRKGKRKAQRKARRKNR